MTQLVDTLSRFATGPCGAPDEVQKVLRLSLLDWAAVGLAGRDEPVARILRDQAVEDGGAPQATVIGAEGKLPARMAALVNGTTSHALDYDDTHFAHIGHPSVAVIPAALAVAEVSGADGQAFQQAALMGAEASVRVGVWLGRSHYQTGFHQTATAGAFGATVAAGRLLGLDQAQMQMALGLVSTRASGLKSQFGTMGKPFNAGIAAQNGVEAALLAGRGFVSAPAALDGAQGFGPIHHGENNDGAFDGLGRDWLFPKVRHKFHACCHGLHAALEALADLPQGAELDHIKVTTHPRWMSVCNIEAPQTGLEAKFSYRLALAMAHTGHDTGRLDSFTEDVCRNPQVEALRRRIDVEASDEIGEMQARLQVQLPGEKVRVLFHDLDADPGLDVRRAKVQSKADSLIGAGAAGRIWGLIRSKAGPADLAAELQGKRLASRT